ncbi:MAG: TolC family protein [Deltaproteobacteria bacterium]|nr:TolC family protein [Deltaproteobacteria bacterium]
MIDFFRARTVTLVALSFSAACVGRDGSRRLDEARARLSLRTTSIVAVSVPATEPSSLAFDPGPKLSLAWVLTHVSEKSPRVRQARATALASIEAVRAAGRFPNPTLKYEQWAVPLARPWRLDQANMLMVGVRQELPPGLGARIDAAVADAEAGTETARGAMLDVDTAAANAYWDYSLASAESELHKEHVTLTQAFEALSQSAYRASRATQRDVLRAGAEIARLENELAQAVGMRQRARAELNAMLARPIAAPLPEPMPFTPLAILARDSAPTERPELREAERKLRASTALLAETKATAYIPSFMIGIDYMATPTMPEPHGYGAMISFTLPWLNPQSYASVRAAAAAREAYALALEAETFEQGSALVSSQSDIDAALASLAAIDEKLLPRSSQGYESALAAFSSGQSTSLEVIDSLRTYLDARMERLRAIARLNRAHTARARALGVPLAAYLDEPKGSKQ